MNLYAAVTQAKKIDHLYIIATSKSQHASSIFSFTITSLDSLGCCTRLYRGTWCSSSIGSGPCDKCLNQWVLNDKAFFSWGRCLDSHKFWPVRPVRSKHQVLEHCFSSGALSTGLDNFWRQWVPRYDWILSIFIITYCLFKHTTIYLAILLGKNIWIVSNF